jgi:signal transduction histidine kinase
MQASRLQILLTIFAGIFLLGTVLIFAIFALAPGTAVVYRPFLLTAFVVTLFVSLVCIAWLLRGLLRPYSQLVGEAKRAPVAHSGKTQNEAAFVLETFQSVIAQLQDQQEELKRLSDQASQRADSAERFSERIVASMPTALIAFDSAGNATVMNRPARTLFENTRSLPENTRSLPENTRSLPANISPAAGHHFRAIFAGVPMLAELVESCLTSGRLFRREEIEAANGSDLSRRLGATVAPIESASESGSRGALCLITDITEVTRLREQVALKRNLESLGEMSAGLAHEFKNAMAALHGYAQFLQSIDHDQQGQAAADALLQEVRSLSEMITSFLNFARPQPLQLEDVDLGELIRECGRELQPLFTRRRVDLVLAGFFSAQSQRPLRLGGESSDTTPYRRDAENAEEAQRMEVQADTRMLRQAFLNLLRNAAEAVPDDKSVRRVTVRTALENEQGKPWAMISIQDTGDGIAESDTQKIFIPFFTTKSGGHGIGLALAHRVITEHGGTLTAGNAPESGAIFTIRMPQ